MSCDTPNRWCCAACPRPHAAAELDRLIKQRLTECVAQMLLMARGSAEEGSPAPPAPWFSGAAVVRAVRGLAEIGAGAGDKEAYLSQVRCRQRHADHGVDSCWWPAQGQLVPMSRGQLA
jgi:hypothetical protein